MKKSGGKKRRKRPAAATAGELAALARSKRFAELKAALNVVDKVDPLAEEMREAFLRSILAEDIELIDRFLSLGIDINCNWRNARGLCMAATLGEPEYVKALIDRGADVHLTDSDGNTPVISTCRMGTQVSDEEYRAGCEGTAKLLLQHGADPNATNDFGETALDFACQAAWPPWLTMVHLLLTGGARITDAACSGADALANAAMCATSDLLRMLIGAGADVNVKDSLGTTPLMAAVVHGREENAALLLEAGADVSATDLEGQTAHDCARSHKRTKMAKMLEARTL